MPDDRVVSEQVQPRCERRRSELDHEKQHRVNDADERHEPSTDRHEHLRRPAGRDRNADRNPRDEHAECDGHGDVNQLYDSGA
jgi:hypothetical protein